MASPVVSSQTMPWRPAEARLLPPKAPGRASSQDRAEVFLRNQAAVPKLAGVRPASRLEVRPAPEMVSSGVPELDAMTGGLPRGCLSEISGSASSGRTSVSLAALGAATRRGEVCALVDTTDAFDPLSAAGMDFARLLWVRCGTESPTCTQFGKRISRSAMIDPCFPQMEQALRVTDLLLQSGGFGLVAIDLGDVPIPTARRIPLTSWFRFQRAVENTPTVLLVIAPGACAQTCAAVGVRLQPSAFSSQPSGNAEPAHAQIFEGLKVQGELLRSRLERKPAASIKTSFEVRPIWAG